MDSATSRMAGRLLHQTVETAAPVVSSTSSVASASGNLFSQASAYVVSTFSNASYANQLILLLVMGLSGCMVIFLGLMWTAEIVGARKARQVAVKAGQQGYSTPTASMLSPFAVPDLESPTKQLDDAVLSEVSAYNKGVELIINESTDYSHLGTDPSTGTSGYRREARRQLNLKLKASPSLDRAGGFYQSSGKFSPRDPTLSSMAIMRKRSNTQLGAVSRKETFGANDHARIVHPLSIADLTVVESVRNRDIGQEGWSKNPRSAVSRRGTAASSPCASPRDDFSPIGTFQQDGSADISADEKLAIQNTITQNSVGSPTTLQSAVSIGPMDVVSLSAASPRSIKGIMHGVPRKDTDTRLNDSIVLLDPDQFRTEIVLIKLIGTGACGSVHEAIWRGSLCAVKILHPSKQVSHSTVATFRREVELMSTIGDHPGVLKIMAACLAPPNMCIITELATNGSLHAIIHDRRLRPEYSTLLDLSIQIADAIAFCHAKNLVHRDLKTHNILLNDNNTYQVADFGLAMDMDEKTMADCSEQSALMGTSAYMSPEQFSGTKVDDKCDSYAFGCILWECITGIVPWSECNNIMQIVMAVGLERKRPPLPKGVPAPLVAIIRECWRHNSRLRPSMRELSQRLRELKREEQERSTFKVAAEMVAGSRPPLGRSSPTRGGNPGKKGARDLHANEKSPLQPGKAAKEGVQAVMAWNNQWSPIKGLNA